MPRQIHWAGAGKHIAFTLWVATAAILHAEDSETKAEFEKNLKTFLAGNEISDTANFAAEVGRRLGWGQGDDRLPEAQGRLAFAQGRWIEALAQLQKSPNPSPQVMEMIAACLDQKDERYEAAAWKLRAARAFGIKTEKALSLLREYVTLRSSDLEALSDYAQALYHNNREKEAAALYRDRADDFTRNEAIALAAGAVLEEQKFFAAATALYTKALEKTPKSQALAKRVSASLKQQPMNAETAALWQRVWTLFPSDTAARNRALVTYEAIGDKLHAESLLNLALAQDTLSPGLRLRAARLSMARGDKPGAYRHANAAVREGDRSSEAISILAETIEGDEETARLLPHFLAEIKNNSATPALIRAAARGLSRKEKFADACRMYLRAQTLSPVILKGRPEILEDLSRCNDPASLALVVELGGLEAVGPQALLSLSREYVQQKKWDALAKTLARLAEIPDNQEKILDMVLELDQAQPLAAKPLLKRLAEGGLIKAALALAKRLQAENNCPEALPLLTQAKAAGQNVDAMLTQCQLATGDTAAAQQSLTDRFSRDKDLPSLRALLELKIRQKDLEGEITALSLLRERSAATTAEKLHLGLLLIGRGDLPKAGPILEEALKIKDAPSSPGYAKASLIVGLWSWDARRADKAKRHLMVALKQFPDSTAGWRALGQACTALGQWGEAAEAFNRGLQTPGGTNDAPMVDGLLIAAKKSRDKAALDKAYTALLQIDSNHLEAIRFLAEKRLSEKRWKEARAHLKKLTEADPNDGKTWSRFGNCLVELGDMNEAGIALQTAIDLGFEDEEVFINRARAYHEAGAKDMVESIMSFLISRNPKSEKARFWQAKLSVGNGQVGKGPEKESE